MKATGAGSLLSGALLILAGTPLALGAQNATIASVRALAAAPADDASQLKLVVILSRHGVRSPTWTEERLNGYSAQPWPHWSVPPGYQTDRGFELMKRFGSYDRASLAEAGLVAAQGCADAASTYFWADTDQRTMESGRALAEGMFPGCVLQVHSLGAGQNDPVFHPSRKGVGQADSDAAFAGFAARVQEQNDPELDELLGEMQNVLQGCAPKVACVPVHGLANQMAAHGELAVRGNGDHLVELQGPLAEASSFAEDFLLEYADGMPGEQVGWGKVDEPQLQRFLALHSDYFELIHRTPALARIEASNLLLHLLRTLEQGVERRPVADAVGPAGSKVVVLVGHDTNLSAVAALLGLHWTLDGRKDDTPPGTELAFELWQDNRGAWSLRVTAAMQTLNQLRTVQELTVAAPPAHEMLTLQGCGVGASTCSFAEFESIVKAAIGSHTALPAQSK